ncbi:MAG: hypothetical protein QF637_12745, partial [Acidimicrobiales bacterium]|nr:hypothetical protein [Acidimicrobiales bacterium]
SYSLLKSGRDPQSAGQPEVERSVEAFSLTPPLCRQGLFFPIEMASTGATRTGATRKELILAESGWNISLQRPDRSNTRTLLLAGGRGGSTALLESSG